MIREYVVLDLEMTGLSAKTDQVIEIGAVKIKDHEMIEEFGGLVNPKCKIPERVSKLTGITDEMLENALEKDAAMEGLLDFIDGYILVGQNINMDYGFLKQWAVNHKRPLEVKALDTLKLARKLLPSEQSKKLEDLCVFFGIERKADHRALEDAIETWQVFEKLQVMAVEKGEAECLKPQTLIYHAKKQSKASPRQIQRLKEYRELKGITEEINWENLTKSEASRIMDKYILVHGR